MKKVAWGVIAFLSIGVAAYAVVAYSVLPVGALVHPDMRAGFEAHAVGVYAHVFSAMAALLLGPTQFSKRLRGRRIGLHRLAGRLYLGLGVLVGGLSGLYLSRYAFGGPVASAGFALLALAWLYTGARAYAAIRRKAIDEHRVWMVRNFALSLAAVTLRIYVPLSVVTGLDFPTAYAGIAWLCWVPNLVVAERIVRG